MRKLVSSLGFAGMLQLAIGQPTAPPAAPPAQVPPTTVPRTPGTPTPAPSPDVPRTPGNPVPAPSPEVPRSRGILPPGPGVNPTNAVPPPATSIQPGSTNPTFLTPPTTGQLTNPTAQITNRFQATNAVRLGYFAITNSLASMSPLQAQNVIQVQTALNNLLAASATLATARSAQVIDQSNPQFQQQLQQISARISALAQGPIKPSPEILQRLSGDLVTVFSRVPVSPDAQLAMAVIINQTCNSGRLSSEQVTQLVDNALVTLQGSGVPTAVAHPIRCDLHSIAYELQPNLGS